MASDPAIEQTEAAIRLLQPGPDDVAEVLNAERLSRNPQQFGEAAKAWAALAAKHPEKRAYTLEQASKLNASNQPKEALALLNTPDWDKEFMRGYYEAFLEGLAENETRLLPSGNAGVVEAVARGDADIGMTDTDDVWAAKARGLYVNLVYPRHEGQPDAKGGGTLLIPNTAALIKGGPNPQNARKLMEFLLSEKTERMLAESVSHNIPVRSSLAKDYPEYAIEDPLRVDYRAVSRARSKAVELAMKALTESAASQPQEVQAESREAPNPPEPYHDAR